MGWIEIFDLQNHKTIKTMPNSISSVAYSRDNQRALISDHEEILKS